MLVFTCDAGMTPEVRKFVTKDLSEKTGQKCVVLQNCTGVVQIPDGSDTPPLAFTVSTELPKKVKTEFEQYLSDELGRRCILLTMFTGIIQISEESAN